MENQKDQAKTIYDSLNGVNNKRHQFFYQMMCANGLTPTQANETLRRIKKCKYTTIERCWRYCATDEEKGKEDEYRDTFSRKLPTPHQTARLLREEQEMANNIQPKLI